MVRIIPGVITGVIVWPVVWWAVRRRSPHLTGSAGSGHVPPQGYGQRQPWLGIAIDSLVQAIDLQLLGGQQIVGRQVFGRFVTRMHYAGGGLNVIVHYTSAGGLKERASKGPVKALVRGVEAILDDRSVDPLPNFVTLGRRELLDGSIHCRCFEAGNMNVHKVSIETASPFGRAG